MGGGSDDDDAAAPVGVEGWLEQKSKPKSSWTAILATSASAPELAPATSATGRRPYARSPSMTFRVPRGAKGGSLDGA